jgi:hypothetical protein
VWFRLLQPLELTDLVPHQNERSFADWWCKSKTMRRVKKGHRKGVNTLIILGAWTIWKHRNVCVFQRASPSVNTTLCELKDEHGLWCMAGAKKLQGLGLTFAT